MPVTAWEMRRIRQQRERKKVRGTPQRPRLGVFRSLNHIYAQVCDDTTGQVLASASSLEPQLRGQTAEKKKGEVSAIVGTLIAQRAQGQGITQVVFDRGGYRYHGRVKALAEAAREGGLKF